MYQRIVFDFFRLRISQRHELAKWLGVTKSDPNESDLEYGMRALLTAREGGKLGELAERVKKYHLDIAA